MSAENITLFATDGSIQTNPNLGPLAVMLTYVSEEIKSLQNYPSCCSNAALMLIRHGFTLQTGWFLTDLPDQQTDVPEIVRFRDHSWSLRDEKIFDLTAFQVNPYLIKPLPEGIIVVERGSPLYTRYIDPNNPIVEQFGLER